MTRLTASRRAGSSTATTTITQQAKAADCSRQTVYDHAPKVQAAVAAKHAVGPTRAELLAQNQQLRRDNAQLWDWLAQTLAFPKHTQRQFTGTARAMGLSLNPVLALLALILGAKACPGRSTLQRWVKAAGIAAGRILKSLDARCQAFVLVGCLDEIFFHRRPVLVGIEPTSMVWFWGQKANDRSGATWSRALHGFPALSYVLADAGTGLPAGIAAVHQQRHQNPHEPTQSLLTERLNAVCADETRGQFVEGLEVFPSFA